MHCYLSHEYGRTRLGALSLSFIATSRGWDSLAMTPNIYESAAVKACEFVRSDRSPAALGRFPRKHLFAVSAA